MKIITWVRSHPQTTFLIGIAILSLILLLSIRNCSNNVQDNQTTQSALAQERIKELERKIDEKTTHLALSKKSEDSLWSIAKQQEQKLNKYAVKYADIASKYEKERNKTRELTNVESVELFLDYTEQSEFPVLIYEDSTQYIIPIASIEYTNLAFIDIEEQMNVIVTLQEESDMKSMQIKTLSDIVNEKDKQNNVLTEINNDSNKIISEKDNQIVAEKKKLRQQKIKTYVTGAVGGVLVICSLLL